MPGPPDFDLEITPAGAGYTIQVQAASGGGELLPQPFVPPIDLAALPRVRRDVVGWVNQARITRLSGTEELRQARAFGTALFEHLFADEILASFRESRGKIPPGERLRVRLRLPASLIQLPWELLCDPRDGQFLALAPDLALLHYPQMPTPFAPLRVDGPLQVVAVLASPASPDYPPINLDRELRRIEAALKDLIDRGRIVLDVIRGPGTLEQLRARLRKPVHVLHVLCHGELDAASGEGVLVFEDADGAPEPVNAELLRMQLQKQRGQTRLVLLNSCLGALPASDDPFSSVGAALLRGGVPAVIAMQFELAEDTAAELARVFYAELAAATPIDLALTEARLHLYGRYPSRLDWAIPVLFLRADDGVLFDLAAGAAPVARPSPLPGQVTDRAAVQQVWRQALTAFFTQQWEQAAALLAQVAAADASYEDVQAKLAEARRQLELQEIYRQARELRDADQWQAALGALDDLERQQPGYPDPEGLRRWAEGRQRRQQHYDAALAACDQGDWAAVANATRALLAEFPDDADAQQLLTRAQSEQAAQRDAGRRRQRPSGGTLLPIGLPSLPSLNRWWLLAPALLLLAALGWRTFSGFSGEEPTPVAGGDQPTPAAEVGTGVTPSPAPGDLFPTAAPGGTDTPAETPEPPPLAQLPGRIAFVSRSHGDEPYEIYLINPDGDDRTCLTCNLHIQADKVHPAWSPDGQRIAFVAKIDRPDLQDIYVIDDDGTGLERLTNNDQNELPGDNSDPAWSPDGQRIAFLSEHDRSKQIYVMNADGSEATPLRDGDNPIIGCNPAWSPDGKRIAFVQTCDLASDVADIYILNLDSGELAQLTENGGRNYGPAWSSDGKAIAFYSDRDGGNWDIIGIDVDSKETIDFGHSGNEKYPTGSPDGEYIAFYSDHDGNNDIFVLNVKNPGDPQNITNAPESDDNNPAWSPR